MKPIRCTNPSMVPKTPHWAVIVFEQIYIDDDREEVQRYLAFTDRESWNEHVVNLVHSRPNDAFVAMKVTPATLRVTVNVDLDDGISR